MYSDPLFFDQKDKSGEGGSYYGDCRGRGCSRKHEGIDAVGDTNTSIFAFRKGEVIRADNRDANGYGNQIIIQHEGGISTRYAHLRSMGVSVGDIVGQDQRIGTMGRSGNTPSQGDTHLHFQVQGAGGTQDPLNYFPWMKP